MNWNRICTVWAGRILIFVLVLAQQSASGTGVGDVEVHLNGGDDVIRLNENNTLEIWIKNDSPLGSMTLGFQFSRGTYLNITWNLGYGNEPPVMEHGDAIGSWEGNEWCTGFLTPYTDLNGSSRDTIGMYGGCSEEFPLHWPDAILCYSMEFYATSIFETLTPTMAWCVDNIYILPGFTWEFLEDAGGYAPDYNGVPNSSPSNPDAPCILFGAITRPVVCGDADGSGAVDIDDVVYLIAYIFSGGPPPEPLASGDADCSGDVDIDDVVYLIAYIFSGGNAPCDPDGDTVPDC